MAASGKRIVVLLGHPDRDSFSGFLAETYAKAAEEAGHSVRRLFLGEMQFDPVLWHGYKVIQELEPDLQEAQATIRWADHLVVVYPNWWHTMPAILKGFFDRAWLPGFAFNFEKPSGRLIQEKPSGRLIQRLAGKTARVIIVCGSHAPFLARWKYGDFTNEIARGILGFAGMQVRVTTFGPAERVGKERRQRWVARVRSLGRAGR